MSEFVVEYDHGGIESLSKCIAQCQEEFRSVQAEMNGIVNSLPEAMKGDAQTAYAAGHSKVSSRYEGIIKMLGELTSEMSGATKKMAASDEAAAAAVKSEFGKF